MHQGKPAESVGFFFSLGHSTIAVVGPWVSAVFLLLLAAANAFVLIDLFQLPAKDAGARLGGGALPRFLHPALKLVDSGAQMYPVGLLFGLRFDTATEVALLGISAASDARTAGPTFGPRATHDRADALRRRDAGGGRGRSAR